MSIRQPLTFLFAVTLAVSGVACSSKTGNAVSEPESPGDTDATTELETALETPAATTASAEKGTVRFEVSGSGTAYTIDWDPGKDGVADRETNVALPWTAEFPDREGIEIYQVVVVGGENPGCKIFIDDKEVASEPDGGSAHCTYTLE